MNKKNPAFRGLTIIDNDSGQGLTEYLILLLLIAVISIGATQSLGKTIKGKITLAKDHISKDISLEDKDKNKN